MQNFLRLHEGLEVDPLLRKLEETPELWRQINVRQKFPGSAHHSTETIFLRGPLAFTEQFYFFDLNAIDYPAQYKLRDAVLPIVSPVMKDIQAREIGRVLIVKLFPNSAVDWHIDEGAYANTFSRFHIALKTEPDCILKCGTETQHFRKGEAWWFNHKAPHSAVNPTEEPRIHLIFDAITPLFRPGATNEIGRVGEPVQARI